MLQRIRKLFSQKGQGIVEYALILAFVVAIAAVALSSKTGLGQSIQAVFSDTKDQIDSTRATVQGGGGTDTGTGTSGGGSTTGAGSTGT